MQQYLSIYHNLQSVYQNRFLLTKKFAHSKVLTLPELIYKSDFRFL